jgi:DnaJ-class molecular chaperone
MEAGEFLMTTNTLHTKFKNMEKDNRPKMIELGIHPCGHCNGTGLKDTNPSLPCTYCFGVGYSGFKELDGESVCPDCNSTGRFITDFNYVGRCPTCDGTGQLSWVDAIRKGINLDKIW